MNCSRPDVHFGSLSFASSSRETTCGQGLSTRRREQRLHRPKRCPQQVVTGVAQVNATPSGAVPNERVAAPLSPQVHPPPAGAPVAAYIPRPTAALQTNCYYQGRYTEQELNPPRQVLAELSLLYLESTFLSRKQEPASFLSGRLPPETGLFANTQTTRSWKVFVQLGRFKLCVKLQNATGSPMTLEVMGQAGLREVTQLPYQVFECLCNNSSSSILP